jgi:hypothetical protein
MLIDNVLRVLDMDRAEVPSFREIHKKALQICKEEGASLDLATSDVALYLETNDEEVAKRVAACYPRCTANLDGKGLYCIG